MASVNPNQTPGIAHAYDGSILYRPVADISVAFEELSEELYGPALESKLAISGYSETRQTASLIPFAYAANLSSTTYRTLIDKPYTYGSVQTTHIVDSFERKLDSFCIALKNNHDDGYAEITLDDGSFAIQQAKNKKTIARAKPLPIDDAIARILVKDLLIQAGHDPRDLHENITFDGMLLLLASKSTKTTITRQADHKWDNLHRDSLDELGYGMEINFKQQTTYGQDETTIRLAELGISTILSLGGIRPVNENQPFAVTRLHFETGPVGSTGTIQAGIGNVTPQLYDIPRREQLLLGTYEQFRHSDAFTARLLKGLSRVATIESADFDVSELE